MEALRLCSRPACGASARATLTYVYADSTAVLGPLATYPEPHCYDLCARHADRLTVPSGWELIRMHLPDSLEQEAQRERESTDELYALAHAVKEERALPPEAEADATPRVSRGPRLDTRPRLAVLPQEEEN